MTKGKIGPLGCLVLLVIAGLILLTLVARRPLPPLDRDSFDSAYQRWLDNGPADYDVTIRVTGRQAALYHVQVRGDQVVEATRNGQPLRQSRTLGTWSVPGMFDTMEIDLETVERREAGRAGDADPQLILRCRFDPFWGFPEFYQRTELRDRGSNYDVTFEVLAFAPRE